MKRYLLEVDDRATAELNEKTFTLNGKPAFGLRVLANEISMEVLPTDKPITNEDLVKAREEGQKEAWELAQKLVNTTAKGGFTDEEMASIFGTRYIVPILRNNTYDEATLKVKAWEEEKKTIHVGDIVLDINDDKSVVLKVGSILCAVLYADGTLSTWRKDELKKTGKTADISAILSQIKEA